MLKAPRHLTGGGIDGVPGRCRGCEYRLSLLMHYAADAIMKFFPKPQSSVFPYALLLKIRQHGGLGLAAGGLLPQPPCCCVMP
jgi:hypothetical protein